MQTVSIIICTRDRAESLRATLDSISECEVPSGMDVEVVVVDNGSTDCTREVLDRVVMPNLRFASVSEPLAGLSRARNAGLKVARGDIFLFTDDDVRVPRNWIEGMCLPVFVRGANAVAGGVHFPASHLAALGHEPYYSKRGWFASSYGVDPEKPGFMVGANMAIQRRVVDAIGLFDTNLGAGALGFYEETQFTWRLLEAGFHLVAALECSVEHHFDLAKLSPATLISLAERMGRSEAYINYHWHGDRTVVSATTIRRAKALLVASRVARPWLPLLGQTSAADLQRIQTLAYWKQLAAFAGSPRNYDRELPDVAEPMALNISVGAAK